MAILSADADFRCDEDLGKRLFKNRPEDWHRGAHDSEVNFKTREHDRDRRPPGEVDVGVCGGAVGDDTVKTPY